MRELKFNERVTETLAQALRGHTHLIIFTDGACQPNPGAGGVGIAFYSRSPRRLLTKIGAPIDETTNNEAEYAAVILALKVAAAAGVDHVAFYADSQLMIKQLTGVYKLRSRDLQAVFWEATELAGGFKECLFTWVRREQNLIANDLAQTAAQKPLTSATK